MWHWLTSRPRSRSDEQPLTERPPCLVQFLIGRGGGGHKASARAVRDCLIRQKVPWAEDVEFVDAGYLLDSIITRRQAQPGRFDCDDLYNWFMKNGCYRLASLSGPISLLIMKLCGSRLRRGLEIYFLSRQPDAVVSFVPFSGDIVRDALLRVCPTAPLLTVVTDMEHSSFGGHSWIPPFDPRTSVNHTIVAGSKLLQTQAAELGYPPSHILATSGMVVHPDYYEAAEAETATTHDRSAPPADLATEATGIVFFGGFAPTAVVRSLVRRALASHATLQLVVICGGNTKLVRLLKAWEENRLAVEGFIPPSRIRDIFRRADFVIGKPGPGVVAEALVCGVPYVTEASTPLSQEVCVLDWLRSSGMGVLVSSFDALPVDLISQCSQAREVARGIQNRAVFELTDHLASIVPEAGGCRHMTSTELSLSRTPSLVFSEDM